MSQIEMNKAIIQRYFEAYNNKNETIFDEIIDPLIWAPREKELMEQRMTLGIL
jgi:hypothetical protein